MANPLKDLEEMEGNFIRDICSVAKFPHVKSDMRRRLGEITSMYHEKAYAQGRVKCLEQHGYMPKERFYDLLRGLKEDEIGCCGGDRMCAANKESIREAQERNAKIDKLIKEA